MRLNYYYTIDDTVYTVLKCNTAGMQDQYIVIIEDAHGMFNTITVSKDSLRVNMDNERFKECIEVLDNPRPAVIKQECDHKNFFCQCSVFRLTDEDDETKVTGYRLEVKTYCTECGTIMRFVNMPQGFLWRHATTDPFGIELRAPLVPSNEKIKIDKTVDQN